jgi:hypothetical protein
MGGGIQMADGGRRMAEGGWRMADGDAEEVGDRSSEISSNQRAEVRGLRSVSDLTSEI